MSRVRLTSPSWCDESGLGTALAEFIDPYVDAASGVLRNRLGLRDQRELDAAENELAWARTVELRRTTLSRTNDLAELRAIHRHLFQDVYDWAGHVRTVDLRKPSGVPFLPVSLIERSAAEDGDLGPLVALFEKVARPSPRRSGRT